MVLTSNINYGFGVFMETEQNDSQTLRKTHWKQMFAKELALIRCLGLSFVAKHKFSPLTEITKS